MWTSANELRSITHAHKVNEHCSKPVSDLWKHNNVRILCRSTNILRKEEIVGFTEWIIQIYTKLGYPVKYGLARFNRSVVHAVRATCASYERKIVYKYVINAFVKATVHKCTKTEYWVGQHSVCTVVTWTWRSGFYTHGRIVHALQIYPQTNSVWYSDGVYLILFQDATIVRLRSSLGFYW